MSKLKVMIIGVDGATFDIIFPLMEKGYLPNFKRLISDGVHGYLRSTIHPITPQAWSTFLTGKNAGKHGIYDFMRRRDGSYEMEFANASVRSDDSIFMYLSKRGRKVGAIAIPFTFPPEPVNGFMLSGMDSPAEDERAVYPKAVWTEIRNKFSNYHIHLASPIGRKRQEEGKFWDDIQAEDDNRTEISTYLWNKYPCDLFMTTYTNTDRVQHQYFTEELEKDLANGKIDANNLLIKSYLNVDSKLELLLECAEDDGDTMVIVMSDHGSGPIRRFFYLNRWLEQNGFLVYLDRSEGLTFGAMEKARYMAKRFLPRRAKNFLKTFLPALRDKVESYRFFRDIDWSKTKAYGFGMYGNIFINLQGRQPQGTVSPGSEYDNVSREIIEAMQGLRDPITGEAIVENVYRREELYHGPRVVDAPDLIIGWKDYSFYTSNTPGRERGDCFGGYLKIDGSDFLHLGTHRLDGIFIAKGRELKKGAKIDGARIADVAPTVLYALGEEIPADMDGRVLSEIFAPSFLSVNRITIKKTEEQRKRKEVLSYSDQESGQVEARLKALGYL